MKKELRTLIKTLEENNESYELYPSTKEMIEVIYNKLDQDVKSVLDIGAGTCNFKKFINELNEGEHIRFDYYVIEKSRVLINNFDKDVIVIGTDFHNALLLDKPMDVIFCNPPYSEYVDWVTRIITEGNFRKAYFVIPERWKDNKEISAALKKIGASFNILGHFDFLDAERSAWAVVNVVEVIKIKSKYERLADVNESAFDEWFRVTFNISDELDKKMSEEEKTKHIKDKLICCESKIDMLVDLYNDEITTLLNHFKAITSMDEEILETIGVNYKGVKNAIKQKTKSLKIQYWNIVFSEVKEITERLTSKTREKLRKRFSMLNTAEFTTDNIYALIVWVIKNANNYYNEQLIDFYKQMTSSENVKPYKSNQKTFEKDRWRFNQQNNTHYTLDYRLICSWLFGTDWKGRLDGYENAVVIADICAIANNLGFKTGLIETPKHFGERYQIKDCQEKEVLIEYRIYQNKNTHIKLNIELCKAINVEASRLLGWVKCRQDIIDEFPDNMKDAVKYLDVHYKLQVGSLLLLNSGASNRDKNGTTEIR